MAGLWLAAILAFVDGLVDVLGYLDFQQFTSHVSGSVATIATALNREMPGTVIRCMSVLVSFLAGCAVLVNFSRRRSRESLFALPLLLEALMLCAVGSFVSLEYILLSLMSLAFAMGLQNATITKISEAEIRTTHVTGVMTDLGIELGRAIYPNRDRVGSCTPATDTYGYASLARVLLFHGRCGSGSSLSLADTNDTREPAAGDHASRAHMSWTAAIGR